MKLINQFVLTNVMLLFFTLCSGAAFSSPQIIENITIFRQKQIYACFPEIFIADDGVLVVKFSARTVASHYGGNAVNKIMISKDKGRTWCPTDKVYMNPAHQLSGTTYVVPYVEGWKTVNEQQALFFKAQGIEVHLDRGKQYVSQGAFFRTTSDNGATWRKESLQLPPLSMIMTYNLSSYLTTSSGYRMQMLYGKFLGSKLTEPLLVRSADGGKNWQYYSKIQAIKNIGFNETALVELKSGDVFALMRPDPIGEHFLYSSISKDNGLTWSLPTKTTIVGLPANLIGYRDYIIASYGYRKSPMGVRVQILSENGQNAIYPELILRADSDNDRPSDVGYPMTVSLGNDEFFTVYYITVDTVTHIAGTHWRLRPDKHRNK